ncbi:MAG: serine hydrolase [Candidatus Pacebacteria bacterium]|nr:serine hydrolase [Candidatus Paceibacterota bacterium]
MKHRKLQKSHFPQIALALAFVIGSFSIFSVAFGIRKNHIFTIRKADNSQSYSRIQNQNNLFYQNENAETDEARYILQHLENLGAIRAQSFLVGDLDTGEIIFERKPHTQYPIASVTKYMTAFTAATVLNPNELSKITREKLKVEGNRGHFKIGDSLTIKTLLYPLLLVSSNDAGEIIAQQRNRAEFINVMNNLSQINKLHNTRFEDPTGLSKNNVSTARDLFKMMRIVRNSFPQIVDISELNMMQTKGYTWRNINKASHIPEFEGGKTGYTNAARQTSIGYYQIKLANDQTKNIGVVILQSNTRQQDTRNVLDYLKRYVAYL